MYDVGEEIAQLVKAPTTKTDDLSLVPEPTRWEEKLTPASHPDIHLGTMALTHPHETKVVKVPSTCIKLIQ